jgi:glycosyltransferase involved in cell wall biosynthesis
MLVNITIPVFNEEKRLARCLPRLHNFLAQQSIFPWEIVIANNASTDRTQAVAEQFSREFASVRVLWIPEKGRGGALKQAWLASTADVLSYMDVDLATDLAAFPALVEAVSMRGFDIAIGSRLLPDSCTNRGWKRDIISRCYIWMVRSSAHAHFSDAQCGFKALSRRAAQALLPQIRDTGWFFDTELLVLAERLGYRIGEVPVRWTDDADTRVHILNTALADLKGLLRLRRELPPATPLRSNQTGIPRDRIVE